MPLEDVARFVTSRGAQRTVVNLSLLVIGSACLLCTATISTSLFYHNYLPEQVLESPLFLQYGVGLNPFALSSLATANLKSQQAYDISISLNMPRSPANVHKGNFMINLYLLDSAPKTPDPWSTEQSDGSGRLSDNEAILFRSRRPAIVPHEDPVVSLASRLIFLPYYLLVPRSQVVKVDVEMAKDVVLGSHYSTLPGWVFIELVAGQALETYSASIVLTAQLRGLRWLMHHYRVLSFLLATALFWTAEVLFMLAAWVIWANASGPPGEGMSAQKLHPGGYDIGVKKEEDELSDVPRTFPTYGGQPPLIYEPNAALATLERRPEGSAPVDAEADDEADDDASNRGLATSYERVKGDIRQRSSHHVSR